jgi:hypothetical protein
MAGVIALFRRYWWVIVLFIGLRFVGQSFLQFVDERMTTAATGVQVIVVTATPEVEREPTSDVQVVVVTATPEIDRGVSLQPNTEDADPTAADALSVFVPTPTAIVEVSLDSNESTQFVINSTVEFWQPRRYVAGMQIASVAAFQEALLDAIRQKQTTFQAEIVGDPQLVSDVYAVIDNYWHPRQVITLELTSEPLSPMVAFALNYQTIDPGEQLVQQRVSEIVDTLITPGMHPHQQVRVLHDWVVLNTAYDMSFTRYGADDILRDGMAVCNGYGLLLEALLTEAGFNALFVTGAIRPEYRSDIGGATLSDGGHAWNMVQLDGQWYHLDATWDDPVPDTPGRVEYAYYMLTDAEMSITRTFDTDYSNFMRPQATTSYADALATTQARDATQQQALADIWRDTHLMYLSDVYLFDRADIARFDAYVAQHAGGTFVFRARSEADVEPLVERYVDIKQRGVLYYHREFERSAMTGDILVEIMFDD